MSSPSASTHAWKFFRTGGLDQVALESGADLLALEHLDQELWVALSCPVKGLELDEKTLALIDTDRDGRIGVPEVLAAIRWASARLTDSGELLRGGESLPLTSISTATAEGRILLASAQQILAGLGRKAAAAITVGEASDTARILAASALNGDGIIPPQASDDPAVQSMIKDIIACVGGSARQSGTTGVTAENVAEFLSAVAAYAAWTERSGAKEIAVLGDETDAACAAIKAVRAKVDDFFARCRLAEYDARSVASLNRNESDYLALTAKDLKSGVEEVAGFPLAHIAAGRSLPLLRGVNPAWAGALAALHATAVAPLFGAGKSELTATEWTELNGRFAAYETWLGSKPGSAVEKLGLVRCKEILAGDLPARLATLLAQDKALEAEFKAIGDVERLARYHRDLRTLLHNFVNFADFYSPDRYATFQAGTLFLDSRSTELCIRVDGVSPLAAMSKAYIAYCTCTRAGGGATMTIAACFTQGDGDYLFVGRNGIFYDRKGQLWYAVITSIVDNPISVRQAFWSPYKKFLRMIEEQVAKRAAAADAESHAKLASTAEKAAQADKAPPAPPKKVDVGAVAAIGVVMTGAISALTLILGYIFQLRAWQYPLVLLGIVLVISGPSMLIALLKLRQRTLGPILEGNGWAINGRVKINIPFGAALTRVAALPAGAKRSLADPYEDKAAARRRWQSLAIIVLLGLVGAAIWIRHKRVKRGYYFWQPVPSAPATSPGKQP